MNALGAALTIFGGINLLIVLISGSRMQKEIINPNCPQDAKDVAYNKKWFKILLPLTGFLTILGIVLWLI